GETAAAHKRVASRRCLMARYSKDEVWHNLGSVRRGGIGSVGVVGVLGIASFFMRALAPPTPNPPGSFSIGIMGDAPYFLTEEIRFRLVLQDLDAHDLTTVISVGDIFWRPCPDATYQRRDHPVYGV